MLKGDFEVNHDQMFVQGSSTVPGSIPEPQGHDMDVDEQTNELPPYPQLGMAPPCPIPVPLMTVKQLPASYKTKKVIYVPDFSRYKHTHDKGEAQRNIGFTKFLITPDEYKQVKKLEGSAVFLLNKATRSKKMKEVIMQEWVCFLTLFQ